MGLALLFMEIMFSAVLSLCMAAKPARPVVTTYYDCCSPSLQADAKIGCRELKGQQDARIVDENGDTHIFTWSDCEPGKERWREWE